VWSFSGRGAMIAAMFLINVALARLLDPASFGQFLLCFAVVSVAGLLCPLGVNNMAVRFVTGALRSADRAGVWPGIGRIFAAASIGGVALVILMVGPGAPLMYRVISAGQPVPLLLLATALWTAGYGLQLTQAEVLRAAGWIGGASFAAGGLSHLGLV